MSDVFGVKPEAELVLNGVGLDHAHVFEEYFPAPDCWVQPAEHMWIVCRLDGCGLTKHRQYDNDLWITMQSPTLEAPGFRREPKVYFDLRDWWVGYYRGEEHHYVCPLPTLVIRWRRRP